MTIEKKNCDECIFKRYTFDKDGKGTIPICHGKYRSRHEAIVAISEDTCDMYNRGHELYETRKMEENSRKSFITAMTSAGIDESKLDA